MKERLCVPLLHTKYFKNAEYFTAEEHLSLARACSSSHMRLAATVLGNRVLHDHKAIIHSNASERSPENKCIFERF